VPSDDRSFFPSHIRLEAEASVCADWKFISEIRAGAGNEKPKKIPARRWRRRRRNLKQERRRLHLRFIRLPLLILAGDIADILKAFRFLLAAAELPQQSALSCPLAQSMRAA
jgi:hypothetical protein